MRPRLLLTTSRRRPSTAIRQNQDAASLGPDTSSCEQKRIERFVIVDDEPDAFPPGLPQLIVCGPAGLSDPATQQALHEAVIREGALPAANSPGLCSN